MNGRGSDDDVDDTALPVVRRSMQMHAPFHSELFHSFASIPKRVNWFLREPRANEDHVTEFDLFRWRTIDICIYDE